MVFGMQIASRLPCNDNGNYSRFANAIIIAFVKARSATLIILYV